MITALAELHFGFQKNNFHERATPQLRSEEKLLLSKYTQPELAG